MGWKVIQTLLLLGELGGFAGAYVLHLIGRERLSAICPWVAVLCLIVLVATDPGKKELDTEVSDLNNGQRGSRGAGEPILDA